MQRPQTGAGTQVTARPLRPAILTVTVPSGSGERPRLSHLELTLWWPRQTLSM